MLRVILLAILVLTLMGMFLARGDISLQTQLEHMPQNPAAAAAVFLVLYLVKSVTMFFPLIILQIAAGNLFARWASSTPDKPSAV